MIQLVFQWGTMHGDLAFTIQLITITERNVGAAIGSWAFSMHGISTF